MGNGLKMGHTIVNRQPWLLVWENEVLKSSKCEAFPLTVEVPHVTTWRIITHKVSG